MASVISSVPFIIMQIQCLRQWRAFPDVIFKAMGFRNLSPKGCRTRVVRFSPSILRSAVSFAKSRKRGSGWPKITVGFRQPKRQRRLPNRDWVIISAVIFDFFFMGRKGKGRGEEGGGEEGEGGFCSVSKWWRSFANLTWFSRDSLPCPKIVSGRGSATQRSPSSCRTRLDSWNFPSPTDFSSPVGRCFISWVFFLIYELWCGSLYRSERRCYVQWMEFISKFIVTRWSSGPDKMDAQHWWPLYRLWLAGAQYFSL